MSTPVIKGSEHLIANPLAELHLAIKCSDPLIGRRERTYHLSPASLVRCAGVLLAIGLLYSAAANWGWNSGALPAPPIAAMLLVFVAAAATVLLEVPQAGWGQVVGWAVANAAVAMAAFLWSSGSDVALQEVQTRTLSSMQLVAFLVLVRDRRALHVARLAIVASTLLSIGINLWETTHPLAFSMALGRSAGFYVNPNIAAAALVSGMLLGLPAVPRRLREPFALACGVGVLTTLSRGGLLCWLFAVALLIAFRGVRGSRVALLSTVGAVAGLSLAGALLASGELGYIGGGAERFVRQRLSIGNREELGADVSASSRSQLAMHALEMFGERPLTGHGTGATVEWREPESTHNVYVRQLAEYGFTGAWLAPALLLIGWRGARRSTPRPHVSATDGAEHGNEHRIEHGIEHDAGRITGATSRTFVAFAASWGLFSHNVLDDAFVLVGIAIVVSAGLLAAADRPAHAEPAS